MHNVYFFDKRNKNVNLDLVGHYPSYNFPKATPRPSLIAQYQQTPSLSHLTSCLPEGNVAVLGCGTRLIAGSHVPRVIQYPSFFLSGKVHSDVNF